MNFKDSGIEWVGQIPFDWDVKKIKWLSSIKRGASPRPIDDPKFFDVEGEYAWVRIADVSNAGMFLEQTKQRMSELGASLSVKREPGDIFVSIAGTVGKPCITNIKCCIHDGFVYFPDYKGDKKYLYYIFESGAPYKGLGKMGTQLNLNTETIGSIKIPDIPVSLQKKIGLYLDSKVSGINHLLHLKQKQIDFLEQQRQSIVTEAVTKGLNPNVKMKDSGVEWIGEIPEHWKVSKLKYHSIRVGDGLHGTPTYDDQGEYYFINGNNLGEISIKVNEKNYKVNEEEFISHGQKIRENTILISLNGTIGNVSVYNNEKIMLSKSAGYISLENDVDVLFVYHWLKNVYVENYFTQSFAGTTIKNLSLETLRNTPILMMPLNEQKEIANYLKGKIKDTNFIIGEVKNQIEKLKEYRQALIYETVTGKIDVRYMELD